MSCRDVRTRIFWRPRPRPQDSVDNRPRTSADVQRLTARCQLQSSRLISLHNDPLVQRRGCLCLERGFTTNSLFCVTYYSYNFNLKKALLRNHDFSGACPRPRPQLNKILRPRPSADAQKARGRVRTASASAHLWVSPSPRYL